MIKRDYELIAAIVKGLNYPNGPLKSPHTLAVAIRFSIILKDKNPRFDSDKFLRDCGAERVI